jgi:hypothetical protein
MKKLLAAGTAVLVLVALGALLAMASGGGAASAASQYRKPALALLVTGFTPESDFTFHVVGSGYSEDAGQPGGQLVFTCLKDTQCSPYPSQWGSGPVDLPYGSFYTDFFFYCGSGIKSAVAVDSYGVKSSPVKAPC